MRRAMFTVAGPIVLLATSIVHAQSPLSFQLVSPDSCPLDNTNTPTACFSVGGYPLAVTTADFDNDGKGDVATANNFDGDVTVLFGLGNGTFNPTSVTLPIGTADLSAPSAIAVADFDNNGKPDLVVADELDTVSIVLNQGAKAFSPAVITMLPTNTSPEGVAVGDFNHDGFMDVAIAGELTETVTILLGTGDGNLAPPAFCSNLTTQACHQDGDCTGGGTCTPLPPIQLTVGNAPVALVAADLDMDANHTIDLAVVNSTGDGSQACGFPPCGTITILKGMGDGTFVAQPEIASDSFDIPVAIAVGDLGNGKPGLAVVNEDGDSVTVLLGKGDLTFTDGGAYTVGSVPEGVVIADFDGDGQMDIATSGSADDTVSVVQSLGGGAFEAAATFPVEDLGAPFGIAAGDLSFPKDQKPEIITANSGSDDVSVLLNGSGQKRCAGDCNGDGQIGPQQLETMSAIALSAADITGCSMGDRNGDNVITVDEILAAINNALTGCPNAM